MTLQESVQILKTMNEYLHKKSTYREAVKVLIDAVERSIDIKEWDEEEAQIDNICHRCNGQGCTKCS